MGQINSDMYNGLINLGFEGSLPNMFLLWKENLSIVTLRDEYDYYVTQGFPYGYEGELQYWESVA